MNKKKLTIFLTVAILIIHLFYSHNLRSIGYDRVPDSSTIMDERTYTWQGLSIRKNGIPIGWVAEIVDLYPNRMGGDLVGFKIGRNREFPNLHNFRNFPQPLYAVIQFDYGKGVRHTQIIQPYLEKPPLGGLIFSAFIPPRVEKVTDVSPWDFRRASLYLALLTEIFIFLLGWQIFDNAFIGLLSALFYGSIPTFILLSRYALLENVLTPQILLMLNLLIFIKKGRYQRFSLICVVTAGIVAGLAALTKQAGWIIIFLGIFLLWFWQFNFKKILLFSIPAFFLGCSYFIWGLYLSPDLFINLYLAEGIQKGFVGSLNLLTSAIKINILNFPFEGWWLSGFMVLLLIPRERQFIPIFASVVAIIMGALLMIGYNNSWYLIPLIPFMCLAFANLTWRVLIQPKVFEIVVFFFTLLSTAFYWGYIVFKNPPDIPHYQYQPFNLYRLLFLLFLVIGVAWNLLPQLKKFKILWIILMVGLIYQLIIWNDRALIYMISHWGKLPSVFSLGVE